MENNFNYKRKLARLRKYHAYNDVEVGICLRYEFDSFDLKVVCERNHLQEFGDMTRLSNMCKIMHHVFEMFECRRPAAKMRIPGEFSALTIDYLRGNHNEKISCWMYAVYLTECFLALGVQARMIRCFSGTFGDNECHCVTLAYCGEYSKFVLFDVANNSIYYSYKGLPLSLAEFRQSVMNESRIFYVQRVAAEKKKLLFYWVKNLMVFQSYEIQRYGNELGNAFNIENRQVFLLPINLRLMKGVIPISFDYPIIITRNEKEFWQE